jgi:hypothetical protein
MHTTDIWNKLNLYSKKVALFLLVFFASIIFCSAQRTKWVQKNNPNYDERKLTYGFLLALHTNSYNLKYDDVFVTPAFDSLHSVEPQWSTGFTLGFIVNYKLADFFDLRMTPMVAFYEHKLKYKYTNDTPENNQLVETTVVEFPVLLKYKSERRGNIRMYMIGGVKPGIEASAKRENVTSSLEVGRTNVSAEFGFGFDLYYPLFKFSPEIRFSKGLVNMLENKTNPYGQPIDRLRMNTITVFLLFQ